MAELRAGDASAVVDGSRAAEGPAPALGKFDRDTAVWRETDAGTETVFGAQVAPDWRAGRGPHGGYLAAMLLRALTESVADGERAPRSLTIHYARAPEPGPVSIRTSIEREGRSLSTLSARMLQGETLIALALGAFSVPWSGPEISTATMPTVDPPDPAREGVKLIERGGPEFARHLVLQPRVGGTLFAGGEQPMEIGCWIGLAEPRVTDPLSLAFFSDALIPAPYMRMAEPVTVPTIDLTVHFLTHTPRPASADGGEPDPRELCLAVTRTKLIHEGFFVEDGAIWAPDGALLAQSRQLAIVIPFATR
ncbi:MAG TPA: thioesterase family protein [Solirubrobacteraceae bacterium]|nr:thioesterase family protein [Solirubrobacteraceae bacterium]